MEIFGYHWMPNEVWRTSRTTLGRGGAAVTSFDMEQVKDAPLTHGRVYTEAEIWENYEYYMNAILPVAEEAGVKLALHPDDPPVESLAGVPRLFRNFEGFKRGMEIADSPIHGLDFLCRFLVGNGTGCHGCDPLFRRTRQDFFTSISEMCKGMSQNLRNPSLTTATAICLT